MIWIAGLCVVCFGSCLPLFLFYKKSLRLHLAAAYKSLGTLCAFLPALIAAIRLDPACWICAAALLLYAVADYFLEFQFMLGAGFFLAGHVCSVAFFLRQAPVSAVHLVCLLLLGATSVYVFYRWRKPVSKQMPLFAVYVASLVLMCVCAIGCFPAHGVAGILIAAGGALFYISDFFLFRRLLFPTDRIVNWIIMITYYAALMLFGTSCLYL